MPLLLSISVVMGRHGLLAFLLHVLEACGKFCHAALGGEACSHVASGEEPGGSQDNLFCGDNLWGYGEVVNAYGEEAWPDEAGEV